MSITYVPQGPLLLYCTLSKVRQSSLPAMGAVFLIFANLYFCFDSQKNLTLHIVAILNIHLFTL